MLDERTMLQATLARLDGVANLEAPLVVCNVDHAHLVESQLTDLGARLVLEPEGRNTAPAVAAGALVLTEGGADPVMLVLPADHVITDEVAFRAAIATAVGRAAAGELVAFGVVPRYPETGYGYIRAGAAAGNGVRRIEAFVEKPDPATARAYVAGGDHLWNSGMFVFRASGYLEELGRWAPDIVEAVRRAVPVGTGGSESRGRVVTLDAASFAACRSDSIDFAVMEHTDRAVVVPLDAGWSDVGSWSALWGVAPKDDAGNVIVGDVVAVDVADSYLRADSRLLAVAGISDVIVVETGDAVLVVSMDHAQQVKEVVTALHDTDRHEAQHHAARRRRWGTFEAIAAGDGYLVGRFEVAPGGKLSLQPHHDRAEEWIVVAGTGVVEVGSDVVEVAAGSTVGIPAGAHHGVENSGEVPLVVVEVGLDATIDHQHVKQRDGDPDRR
jgi:mannose-1-phosphate guanylyltransferase/mannose-6-phosphate isomerase